MKTIPLAITLVVVLGGAVSSRAQTKNRSTSPDGSGVRTKTPADTEKKAPARKVNQL
ncbi:hypothetical protein [Spirosoma fluviale]|uniref:Uncharacterized protein n=1 Tax=Spirosoma fluviale TaxID=1597977 RepID=A0A286FFJ9_9BACT|nr:hypothetical protein [Spirosoma fluviale]SOD81973.1 hypothetical protein SAMN06269250_1978 [Spirosoma fluviale]